MNEIMNDNPMSNVFRKVQPGKCRIAFNGQIAVETSGGYKTFSSKTKALTNCSSFVSNMGDELFYVVPAAKVYPGDIILIGGIPRCVISCDNSTVTVMTYESGCIEQILPERQMFMGNVFFFSKIVSPMLGMFGKGKGKMSRMMKIMMLSDMTGHNKGDTKSGPLGSNLMQLMMMQEIMKDAGSSFDGLFDELGTDDTDVEPEELM